MLLADQDRTLWNAGLITEGQGLVRRCLRRDQPGPYQIQDAINKIHSDAEVAAWWQILTLYDQLMDVAPTPVAALNRAIAVAEPRDPAEALGIVEGLALNDFYLFHAVRAELLRRLGRTGEAIVAYRNAESLADNQAELRFLQRRRVLLS